MNVAIVTMTRCPKDLPEWIEYHLGLGISRIYLRLEGERLMDMSARLRQYPDVSILETQVYPEGDQMVRQIFLVETAIEKAREESMDFLLHIDDDELLYIHPDLHLQELLLRIDLEDPQYDYLHIENVEAVYPHTKIEADRSCYQKTTLFRECKRVACRSYGNGKSMARLSRTTRPDGVHYFKGVRRDIPSSMALILHFESCDFDLWKEKFIVQPPSAFDFYTHSHRAVHQLDPPQLYQVYKQLTGFHPSDPLLHLDPLSKLRPT